MKLTCVLEVRATKDPRIFAGHFTISGAEEININVSSIVRSGGALV